MLNRLVGDDHPETRLLLHFLRSRTTGPTTQENPPAGHSTDHSTDIGADHSTDHSTDMDAHLDGDLMDRLQEIYVTALPGRLSAITDGARSGDTTAVEAAAQTLAGTSGQLGHPDVAFLCRAIAADARRGVLAHARLVELRSLAN